MKKLLACLLLLMLVLPAHAAPQEGYAYPIDAGWARRWDGIIVLDCEPARYLGERNDYLSLLDAKGNVLKDAYLNWIGDFEPNGLAHCGLYSNMGSRWGLVNKSGELMTDLIFDYIAPGSEGLYLVEIDELRGYIDETGAYVLEPQYFVAQDFVNGRAAVGVEDKYAGEGVKISDISEGALWGVIDREGNIVVECKYDYIEISRDMGVMKARLDGLWGLMDLDGNVLTPFEYEQIYDTFRAMNVYLCEGDGYSHYFCIKDGRAIQIPYPEAAKEVLG